MSDEKKPWRDAVVLLDAKFKPDPAVWRAAIEAHSARAAVDPLAAMTAERDALRAAIRTHRDAMHRHRAVHQAVDDALERGEYHAALADAATATHEARAALKASREALFALVPE